MAHQIEHSAAKIKGGKTDGRLKKGFSVDDETNEDSVEGHDYPAQGSDRPDDAAAKKIRQ